MLDFVKKYYGEVLQSSGDLKTNACCTAEAPPPHVNSALAAVHEEVSARYYGCGLLIPEALRGCRVLDLGCGTGRDCYLLAQLVGPDGAVVGVDMTDAQLEVAEQYRDWHAKRFGYAQSNVSFHKAYIEALDELPLQPGSFDLIVSNCVINLSPDKAAVLRGAYELLKPGGELYFADVYCDRRIPEAVAKDPVLYGECLGGALYWNDFLNIAKSAGFQDPRLVADRPLELGDERIERAVGDIRFYSATYRLFKLEGLEAAHEDYGQAVIYRGSVEHHPELFRLDSGHSMETGKRTPVCGNTFEMLKHSRLAEHFEFIGDKSRHFGIFSSCGTVMPFEHADTSTASASGDKPSGSCC